MPLPKPSKMISKRFKKPKPKPKPKPAPSPSSSSCTQPWHPHPFRERKIRVVCTDPDATDDSSSDEASPSSSSPLCPNSHPRRKRIIREFSLPLPSPPHTPQRRRSPFRTPRARCLCPDVSSLDADADPLADPSDICQLSPPSLPAERADVEEEFVKFLREFLPEQDDEGLWKLDAGRSDLSQGSGGLGEMLDLELDSEALSWINSLQRLT